MLDHVSERRMLIEKMEHEGVVGPANHAGKRDVLAGPPPGG